MKDPLVHRSKTVLLVLEMDFAWGREVAKGVVAFARPTLPWRFVRRHATASHERLRSYHVDGIIGTFYDNALLRRLRRSGVPLVTLVDPCPQGDPGPAVLVDHVESGRLAGRHFLQAGFRSFAYVGYEHGVPCQQKLSGFREALSSEAVNCQTFYLGSNASVYQGEYRSQALGRSRAFRSWLAKTSRPLGLLASDDTMGMEISQVCAEMGLRIPEDVSIIGMYNDDVTGRFSLPTLSSIAAPGERVGYEAAAMLHQLFSGQRPANCRIVLPPIGIVHRQSTDMVAVDDPETTDALRFMRDHAHERIGVADVLGETSMSRRSLQRKLRAAMGMSPAAALRRMRIERAKMLLAHTDKLMPLVAAEAGFSSSSKFSAVFRKSTGMTPRQFRRQSRLHDQK